ncbi:hypothetical protein E2562_023424 [Oryza meyeriana var. granulata]|uniref:Uncharacterized protein n=1 Tax=Oryza meyeriana var. granulata TaxID=110450 RepID=A0A6G1FBE4_9ORYZ|nr:hypothetical protein E2562_023424 [Oryza meyeriana var. granulata]
MLRWSVFSPAYDVALNGIEKRSLVDAGFISSNRVVEHLQVSTPACPAYDPDGSERNEACIKVTCLRGTAQLEAVLYISSSHYDMLLSREQIWCN